MPCICEIKYEVWDPVYPDALGPGCVHNPGFSGSLSQASYTCNCAISIMKYKLIIYHLHKNQLCTPIAGMFGGDNVWWNWFDKGFGKKKFGELVYNPIATYIMRMWHLDVFSLQSCAHSPNSPNFPPPPSISLYGILYFGRFFKLKGFCTANGLLHVCHAHFYNKLFTKSTTLKMPFAMIWTVNRALV